MSTSTIITLVIVLIVALGSAVFIFTKYTANPAIVHFSKVNVTDQSIVLEKGSFEGSAMWYYGYSAKYEDGVLSIKIKARSFKLPNAVGDQFMVTIPNEYGDIREVRLSGAGSFPDKVIWTATE